MARKKRRFRRQRIKIPLLTVAGAIPGISNLHRAGSQRIHGEEGYFNNMATEAGRIYIGYDRRVVGEGGWNMAWMWGGTWPLIIGAIGSMIASRMGFNRMFRNMPIRL